MLRAILLLALQHATAQPKQPPELAAAKWGTEPIKVSKLNDENLMPSFFFMPSFGGWGYGMGYGMGGAAMIVRVLMNVLLMYVLYNYLFGGRRGGRGDPNAA